MREQRERKRTEAEEENRKRRKGEEMRRINGTKKIKTMRRIISFINNFVTGESSQV